MNETAIKKTDEAGSGGAAIEALVMRGDISGLGPRDRASYYIELCRSLGLNPATQPIKFIAFQGKMIPYFTRDATDQLAARDRLNRELIEGPAIKDFAGHKMLFAVCRGTLPNGRVETATSVVVIPNGGGENLANAIMRCETKARRRVTLAICGLGFISEDELDTMPGARRLSHAEAMGGVPVQLEAPRRPSDLLPEGAQLPQVIADDLAAYEGQVTLAQAVAILLDREGELSTEDQHVAFDAVRRATYPVPSSAVLQGELAAERARRAAPRRPLVEVDTSGLGESPDAGLVSAPADPAAAIRDGLARLGWKDDGASVPVTVTEAAALWLKHGTRLAGHARKKTWEMLRGACNDQGTELKHACKELASAQPAASNDTAKGAA